MYKDQATAGWNFIKNKFDADYYSDSINLLCVLTSSGHWWSPETGSYCPLWQLGATYNVGDMVSYNGKVYECLQAHTAYAANWNPEQARRCGN
jgi:chitodextrinase